MKSKLITIILIFSLIFNVFFEAYAISFDEDKTLIVKTEVETLASAVPIEDPSSDYVTWVFLISGLFYAGIIFFRRKFSMEKES